jgi:DNA primase
MRGNIDQVKERLDIAELVSGYLKLEKAGSSFKARCPFHNEKTPSFFVSPSRQSFYCFGCGAKGDIFSFTEQVEGLSFREALLYLAEKAGIEIQYEKGESKSQKDKIFDALEDATMFFENKLVENKEAKRYLESRGVTAESVQRWRIGYAPAEWRSVSSFLEEHGHSKDVILKAGLVKTSEMSPDKKPYDVFRDRIVFPMFDVGGRVIAFSGRVLSKDIEPKYLNSPDTTLFTKSNVLYGLDKAKESIRKKNYVVLVEGQIDLVLSHQAGVDNTVAASGTAFTGAHLGRLKNFSSRIILAFDGDIAGEKAAKRASALALSLELEVKIADMPEGKDPAEIIVSDPQQWKDALRQSLPAVEFFFSKIEKKEKDSRKLGKLIEQDILPMIKLTKSAIEQSHFASLIAKRTGIKEEMIWRDLQKVKPMEVSSVPGEYSAPEIMDGKEIEILSQKEKIEERLTEINLWKGELSESATEIDLLKKEEAELKVNLKHIVARENLSELLLELSQAESSGNAKLVESLTTKIQQLHSQIGALEEQRKKL